MFGWIKTARKQMGWALLLCLALLWSWSAEAYSKFARQERQHQQVSRQLSQLKQTHAVREREVQKAARKLEQLKRQAKQGGLLALPARMRLPKARAKAQRLSARLARLSRRMQQLRQRHKQLRRQLRKLYRKRYAAVRKALKKRGLARSQRNKLKQEAVLLARRYQKLGPSRRASRAGNLPQLRVKIGPLDGPIELRQKADRIKDAEDNVGRILRKLQRKLKRLKKKAQRQRNENRLEKWVDTGDTGDSLFQENSRNPRVVTGKSTSDRLRQKNGANSYRATDTTAPQAVGQSEQKANGATGLNKGAAAPPTAGSPDPGRQGTTGSSGGYNSDSSGAGRSTTHLQPKIGPNTTLQPGIGQQGMPSQSYTLNPKGTLRQQLKALKRYKAYLKRYRSQLRTHHKAILKHAKRLRRRR